ncbi:MAG: RNA polymerase sigma factor [Candidatus Dojkabacteria bacterium]
MPTFKDSKLVKLVLEDADNYKLVVERYQNQLLWYIKRVLYINTEDAEDILQEVFIKAYRNINSYNSQYKFSNWIYRIAHNEAINFLRKNKNRKLEVANDPDNPIFDDIASELDIEKEYIDSCSKDEIEKHIHSLEPKYRDVVILKFMEEKDYNEISEILHIPSGTVGSLISRAKVKLRELILLNERSK